MACSSLLVPTSDLEEEWRSESEEERPDLSGQILAIQVEVEEEEEPRLVHLHVSRAGVRLLSDPASLDSVRGSCRTTNLPIIFTSTAGQTSQGRYGEKKAEADLAVGSVRSPAVLTPPADRSVSPDRSAGKLKRQLTFVETSELREAESQTDSRELAAAESQTEEREGREAASQTDRDEREDSTTQTDPLPAREELLADSFPPSRSPLYPLTFSSTQTSSPPSPPSPPPCTTMTSQTSQTCQTSPQESCRVATTSTAAVSEAAADEMVARVLLEHAGAGSEESEESEESSPQSSSSSSTISQASGSLFSVESGRATSYDNVTNRQGGKDLSRTVNYLDLSRLGNEGETPNSDEIWVTVEDDNKFLTSDTETYSVATDKVSEQSVLSPV